MNFEIVIRRVVDAMDAESIRYALIGGFAMALRGVQRATMDLDFILMLDDMRKADEILRGMGYECIHQSSNVSQYQAPDGEWGRIDILHAFRGPTLGMLKRAEPLPVLPGLTIRVVQVEDIIGLKVQASVNNPARETRDWSDIRMMLEASREQGKAVDWELIADYLRLFHLETRLPELKKWHGHAHQD